MNENYWRFAQAAGRRRRIFNPGKDRISVVVNVRVLRHPCNRLLQHEQPRTETNAGCAKKQSIWSKK